MVRVINQRSRGQGERETWTVKRGRRVREAGMGKMRERENISTLLEPTFKSII